MTRDPLTGEIPSQELWNYLLSKGHTMGEVEQFEKARIYPNTWRPIDDFFASLAIQRLVYDPNNTNTMYFCTGEGWGNADASRGIGVWKSENAGKTWSHLNSTLGDSFWYCHDMLVHPVTSDVYVATRIGGLMRSKDGGNSWEKVLGFGAGSNYNTTTDIEITADNELVVCVGNHNTDGIYFSETGDANDWEKRMNGFPTAVERIELATAPSNANVMYAIPISSVAADSNKIHGVYKTTDKGLNWTATSLPGGDRDLSRVQGWYDLIAKVSPVDENFVLIGGLNIFRTIDGGDSWQQMFEGRRNVKTTLQYAHVDQHEITFKSTDTVLFGNDGGIWRCDDIKADTPYFYEINSNYNVTQFYSCAIDAKKGSQYIIGGTQDNGSLGSQGDGISEFRLLSWADGSFCNIDHKDGDIFYTTTQYRRLYRHNHGDIDTLTNPDIVNNNTLFINPIEMDPNDPEILYQLSNRGLWRLRNARTAGKDDWERACRIFGTFSAIGIATKEANTVFLGRSSGGVIYKIENANTSPDNYLPINCDPDRMLPDAYCGSIYVDPKDGNHVMVTYTNYGIESVWESINALSSSPTWTSHEGDLPNIPIRWVELHPDNPNVCYLGTEAGVMMTTQLNGDDTEWKLINEGMANLKVNMLRIRPSDLTIIAATHGRGFFTGKIQQDYSVEWEERGPRNVGGRTRTLVFDPNDPSGKRLWAGSVSGGLWVAENYDSVAVYHETAPSEYTVKVGPNPAHNGEVTVFFENDQEREVSFTFYSVTGAKVMTFTRTIASGEQVTPVDVSCLRPAMYFLKVTSGEEEQVFRLLINL